MIDLYNNVYVYDIEADSLLDKVTKIHCLSVCWIDIFGIRKFKSTTDYDEMRKFFLRKDITRIGQNIILYDERVIAKILGIDTLLSNDQLIDTMTLSWYLFPERNKHGLEEWGETVGIKKVPISDWKNLKPEIYIQRCETDTDINMTVWKICLAELEIIYNNDVNAIIRFIQYLMFKMDCVREQEEEKLLLDVNHIENTLTFFRKEIVSKTNILESLMPKVSVKKETTYNDVIIIDDNSFYTKGDMMYQHYFNEGYRPKLNHTITEIKSYKEPNANSPDQIKNWLFSLGWIPDWYKDTESTKGKNKGQKRKVPQISNKLKDGTLCQSVKKLFKQIPELEVLEGLSILSHRKGLLEGMLENQKEGWIEASCAGLTNTLRLKHRNIVNLPGIDKKYGKEIRGSIIAPKGYILCGSDMTGLEDTTKQHYMYDYDPKYVIEMRTPGFDPHIDIGVIAGIITKEEEKFYKTYEKEKKDLRDNFYPTKERKKEYDRIKELRFKGKTANFTAVYGAGIDKIMSVIESTRKIAKNFHTSYWIRNKSVKQIAENATVKTIGNKKWIYNPVSKFWYNLRSEKDRFSTLNSGTGVYIFDLYVKYTREQGIKIGLQYHDEELFRILDIPQEKEKARKRLDIAIQKVNDEVKLNVPLSKSVDFGYNYAECH